MCLSNPLGLPWWLSGKEEAGSVPVSGSSPGVANGNPLQYSCLGNPMNRGAWQAAVCGVAESDTTRAERKQFQPLTNPRGKMLRLQSLWPGCSPVPWEGEVLPTAHLPKDQLRVHKAPPPSPAGWGRVTHLPHVHRGAPA